ncbi:hypothetical protein FNV43_RR18482 [Rhamnella rubrinervis]|uniref:Uncharacterized protein n=1 Tax=Rhamnella rubrinervis TaxID=2594499 RepID=A0A8K0GW69_9ROSA|nr:hypothetical protein FNV43_RR18482 [Rhamnella rubrinervis]
MEHVTGKCRYSEPATITTRAGLVARIYGPWLKVGVAGSISFITPMMDSTLGHENRGAVEVIARTENFAESSLINASTDETLETKVCAKHEYGKEIEKEINETDFQNMIDMCPELESLFSLKWKSSKYALDLKVVVIDKLRREGFDVLKFQFWARRGLSFLSALEAHRREEVRALELGDLENEMLEWLRVGQSLVSPAHSPRIIGEATNVLQKKREYSEPTNNLNSGEEESYVDSREWEEATTIDEIVSDLQAVEIQVQSTFSPPSNFKLGSSSGRYFTRSQTARSRRSWKDLARRNRGVEDGSGEGSSKRGNESNNKKEKRDFREAEETGQYMPPLFHDYSIMELQGFRPGKG